MKQHPVSSSVRRAASQLRRWLRDAWLNSVCILDRVRGLFPRRNPAAAWEKPKKPTPFRPALELMERRETPDDIFGLLHAPMLGTGIALLGGQMLTPATALVRGWSASASPLPALHVSSSEGLAAPGLSAAPPSAPPSSPALPPPASSGAAAATPTPTVWASPGTATSGDPFADPFADPLGGAWLDAVGKALNAPPTPAVPTAGGSTATPASPAAPSVPATTPTAAPSGAATAADPVFAAPSLTPPASTAPVAAGPASPSIPAFSSNPPAPINNAAAPKTTARSTSAVLQAVGGSPLAFEPNRGQADPQVLYLSQGAGFQAFLTARGAVLSFAVPGQNDQRDVVQLALVSADAARLSTADPLPGVGNYFVGADASQWVADVPRYGQVVYHDVYPGVDLRFGGDAQNQLEYTFTVAPGADPSRIRLAWPGAQSVQQDGQGNLLVTTAGGRTLTESAPTLFQDSATVHTPVAGGYVVHADGAVGFSAAGYDPTRPLVIDPSLLVSSYLGGSGNDKGYAVAADPAGDVFLTGSTAATNFPTTTGVVQTASGGGTDAFVTKFDPLGRILYSTYLGGSGTDSGAGVAVDAAGRAWVVGSTTSTNFPTTADAVARSFAATGAAFAARLGPAGDVLTYSTLLGSGGDAATAVAVDPEGDAFLTGNALYSSINPSNSFFPTTSGAFQTASGSPGATDAFVAKLAPTLPGSAVSVTLAYSSYLGGGNYDYGQGIAADAAGNAYVTGYTQSSNFPTTTGAFKTTQPSGAQASFVAKVNPTGSALVYSTYLAGGGVDAGYGVALDHSGDAFITGATASTAFPTTVGAYQTALSGSQNAFVAKLNPAGSALVYGSYLGGGGETGTGIAVDASGQAVVAGFTTGTHFPTTAGAFQTASGGGTDAFTARLSAAGSTLLYGSYLGGSGDDEAKGLALDAQGDAELAGFTSSTNFPTVNAPQGSNGGGGPGFQYDAFVAKFNQAPAAPVFTAISPDSGSSATDQVTNTGNVTITGTASANATVTLWQEGVGVIDTVTASGGGLWTSTYYASTHTLPEGTVAFSATQTVSGTASDASNDWLVTVDATAPVVTLAAPASTTALQPMLTVTASDRNGLASNGAVTILVYNSTGQTLLYSNSSAATLTDGQATFRLPYALTAGTTYQLKAQVNDLAGNTGTSAAQTVQVTSATAWALASAAPLTADPLGSDALDQLGDVQVAHPLDLDQSPGNSQSGGAALVYHSDSVSVEPVIEATLSSPNNAALPSTITAVLTWNGSPTTFTYSTAADQPGDSLVLNVQVPNAVTTTGRYAWSLSLQATGMTTQTASGGAFVVTQDSSPFGAGWTFGATDQLVSIPYDGMNNLPAGMLRIYGGGGFSFYQGTTTFTSPSDDSGTLTTGGGLYTYTYADGRTEAFNSSGYETQWASADGQETLQFRYDGSNRLTGMTAVDGGLTTFSYSMNFLSTIQTVNSRTYTIANTSGVTLKSITDPDGGGHAFTYDSGHRVKSEAFGGIENGWVYGSSGALASMTWGTPAGGVAPGYGNGGTVSSSVTPFSPIAAQALSATAVGPLAATRTDADNHTTAWQLDSQGRPLQEVRGDGGVFAWTRDANGRVTAATDPLHRTTTFALDSSGYVTTQTNPDGSTVGYQYQSSFHALISMTNERGYTTTAAYDSQGHLTSTTDALGNVTAYAYNGSGLETSVTDALNHTTTMAYDANRRLTTTTDALNHVATFTYDSNGNPLTTTDALGRVVTTSYDVMSRLSKTTDPLGGVATATYDAAGQMLSTTDALTHVAFPVYDTSDRGLTAKAVQAQGTPVPANTLRTFDAAGRATAARDADGAWTSYSYDALGRVTQTTDAMGGTTRVVYDLDGELTASRDALGDWTSYTYNSRGWRTSVTDPLGNTTTTAYDLAGDATSQTDPLNHTTAVQYDKLNRATAVTDALNHTLTTTFDKASNVSTVTDANGNVTSYAYDAVNRRTMTTVAVGSSVQATSTVAYDAVGNLTSSTVALGHTTSYKYDNGNRQTAVTDALNHTTTTAYDLLGNVTATTNALNQTTTFVYDQLNHLLQTTDPLNHATTVVIDPAGDRRAVIDPLGDATQVVYDQDHRPIGTLDALGGLTRTLPNAAGQLAAVVDAVGNVTKYIHDADGRQIVSIDPLGNRTTTTYDAAGRTSTITDRDAHQQVFHYDAADRVTAVTWLSGSATVNLLTYTYDSNGNQLTAADYHGTYTNNYDAQNRLTAQTDPLGLTLTYQYDTASRVTQRADSKGGVLTYVYDNADRLTSEQFGGSGQTQARVDRGYDNANNVTSLTRYTDVAGTALVGTTVYAFDNASHLTAITNKTGAAATLSYYDYTLDNAGRSTQESWQSQNTTGGTISGTHTYSYDTTNQLTAADGTVYSYDLNGDQTMAGYQTGSANRLTNDGTWTYTYDAEGDLTQKSKGAGLETWYYGYDTLNRLTSVEQTSNGTALLLTATYSYDVYNHRMEEDDWQSGGLTTVTKTAYDGDAAWVDLNGSGAVQTRYLAGPSVNEWLGRIDASGVEWLLTDRLGSVRDVVNSAGTPVLDHAEYQVFGGVASDTGASAAGAYGAEGERQDRNTGMVQSGGQRAENTQTHQFLQEDPSQFAGGDANLRRDRGNDPTNATDPTGLASIVVGKPKAPNTNCAPVYYSAWFGVHDFYVGELDPEGFVHHNGYIARIEAVEEASSCWHDQPDWDAWFKEHAVDLTWYSIKNLYIDNKMFAGGTTHKDFAEGAGQAQQLTETYLGFAAGVGFLAGPPISMDLAVSRGTKFVGDGGIIETTKGGNFQFRRTFENAAGDTETLIARFDINPADDHVGSAPHLNLERQINGVIQSDAHQFIDPATIRPGDIPRP